jgi:fructokinase
MNDKNSNQVVCFGEVLWDVLPTVKRPGGAPMNVAYHLQKLGLQSQLISSVGMDDSGLSLLEFLRGINLPTNYVQVLDSQPTSEVIATVSASHEVSYEIVYPVAWDFISWRPEYDDLLKQSRALVYGSLASRDDLSAATLLRMLAYDLYKVFDVNLRAPHYSPDVLDRLLRAANLVKMNAEELEIITHWYNPALENEADRIACLFDHFSVEEILISKGAKGATYYNRSQKIDHPAFMVKVNDTIGSGDSFLAAFLTKRLQHADPATALEYAAGMGAFITSQSGACPAYEQADFEQFLSAQRSKNI